MITQMIPLLPRFFDEHIDLSVEQLLPLVYSFLHSNYESLFVIERVIITADKKRSRLLIVPKESDYVQSCLLFFSVLNFYLTTFLSHTRWGDGCKVRKGYAGFLADDEINFLMLDDRCEVQNLRPKKISRRMLSCLWQTKVFLGYSFKELLSKIDCCAIYAVASS